MLIILKQFLFIDFIKFLTEIFYSLDNETGTIKKANFINIPRFLHSPFSSSKIP